MRKRKSYTTKTCECCDKEYQTTMAGKALVRQKFCSVKCTNSYASFSRSKLSRLAKVKTRKQFERLDFKIECANPDCSNVFTPKQGDTTCCSKVCYNKKFHLDNPRRNHKKKNPCQICGGKIGNGSVNGIRNNRNKFCSNECVKQNKRDKAERDRVVRAKRNCKYCGVEFTRTSSKEGRSQMCCSKECVDLERRRWERGNVRRVKIKKLTGVGYEVDEAGLLAKKCGLCGEDFKARRTIDCYCSKLCLTNATISKRADSDYYYRNLLSRRSTGERGRFILDVPVEFWSDDLVQAKKAEVRLRRTILQQQQQKGKHD